MLESQPITLIVSNDPQPAPKKTVQKSGDTFLRLKCDKSHAFVGEKIHGTLTFYTADSGVTLQSLIEPDQMSALGLTIKQKAGPITGNEVINSIEYRYAMWEWDFYPSKAGTLILPAYGADYIKAQAQGMFSFFFNQGQQKRVYSNACTLMVESLPQGNSADNFIGIIKEFLLAITPMSAPIGDGMALTITITGQGDFDKIGFLELQNIPESLKWYQSKQSDHASKNSKELETHIIEYVLQGLKPGTWQIPAQELTYFDTLQKKYKTITTIPVSVSIIGNIPIASTSKTTKPSINATTTSLDEILPLHPEGPWIAQPAVYLPWHLFWIITALLTLIWILAVLFLYKSRWPLIFTRSSSGKKIYQQARTAVAHAKKTDDYARIYHAFIAIFASQTGKDPAQICPTQIEQILLEKGLSLQAVQDWHEFFSTLSQAVYYQKPADAYHFDTIRNQAVYWIDILEKLSRRNPQ